jgi:hypothetical protein
MQMQRRFQPMLRDFTMLCGVNALMLGSTTARLNKFTYIERTILALAFPQAQLNHAIRRYQNIGVAVEQTFNRRQVKPKAILLTYTTTSSDP